MSLPEELTSLNPCVLLGFGLLDPTYKGGPELCSLALLWNP